MKMRLPFRQPRPYAGSSKRILLVAGPLLPEGPRSRSVGDSAARGGQRSA